MKIILLSHTPDMERLISCAGKLCYSSSSVSDLQEKLTKDDTLSFVDKLLSCGHESPLEHCTFTFGIEGVSRSLTHQLVRHRIASYSQKSQRYVSEQQFEYITPPTIEGIASETYDLFMSECQEMYKKLINLGIPKEDARYVIPNACSSQIIVTMNIRSLLNFFKHRCCNRAQWEIRELANAMLKICKDIAPSLFVSAGASCLKGNCPEGAMSCNRAEEIAEQTTLEDAIKAQNCKDEIQCRPVNM